MARDFVTEPSQAEPKVSALRASVSRAAKRIDPMQAMHEYTQAFWSCNGQQNFRLRYADGWVQFLSHHSSWVFDRKRVKQLVEMTQRIQARTAQGIEARQGRDEGSACESPVAASHAPEGS